jgi:ferric-dicitrate binding protein FerR (iron transport regulator)
MREDAQDELRGDKRWRKQATVMMFIGPRTLDGQPKPRRRRGRWLALSLFLLVAAYLLVIFVAIPLRWWLGFRVHPCIRRRLL